MASATTMNYYKDLFKQLVSRDIKLKYRRSVLGYFWSVLNPLLMMLVMVLVFQNLFKRFDIQNYAAFLITGQTLFSFMTESTSQAMSVITGNAPLLKKAYVPKYIFPVARITSSLINMLFSLIAMFLVIIITGVELTWYILLFPLPIIGVYLFCLGLGLFLSQATVFFRDIQYIWSVLTMAWLYLTPVFYPITIMPELLQDIIKYCNPMYAYIAQFRDIVLTGTFPGYKTLIAGAGWAAIMLVLGIWTFRKNQDRFILYI